MKKIFAIAVMTAMTVSFISCEKDSSKDNGNGDEPGQVVRTHRVTTGAILTLSAMTLRDVSLPSSARRTIACSSTRATLLQSRIMMSLNIP